MKIVAVIFLAFSFFISWTGSDSSSSSPTQLQPHSWEQPMPNRNNSALSSTIQPPSSNHSHGEVHSVKVVSFKLEYVKTELVLTFFIYLIGHSSRSFSGDKWRWSGEVSVDFIRNLCGEKSVTSIQRRFFNDSRGIDLVKQLGVQESSNVDASVLTKSLFSMAPLLLDRS
uniref:Uncharacterized protein n=1 Tax=Ditylenchus dipsaci TaxID=166011 RepID=A0A915DQI8_9BILA